MSLVSEDVSVCVFTFFQGKIQVERVDVNLTGQNDVLVHCPRSIPRRTDPELASKVQRVGRILWHGWLNPNEGPKGLDFLDASVKQGASIKLISHFFFATFEISNASLLTRCCRSISKEWSDGVKLYQINFEAGDWDSSSWGNGVVTYLCFRNVFMIVYLSFNKLQ